jgi:predicted RNase H-like HicB family nuclease/catechol 2,3-dioxygenase-like lactoylglutathione lyase family enzyme
MRSGPFHSFKSKRRTALPYRPQTKKTSNRKREFNVLIEKDSEGFFIASVPELKGSHSQAKSLDTLMYRIREAIELCLEVEGALLLVRVDAGSIPAASIVPVISDRQIGKMTLRRMRKHSSLRLRRDPPHPVYPASWAVLPVGGRRGTQSPLDFRGRGTHMSIKRMDNVLIVVDDLEAVKAFFIELGLSLEGETTVEGPLVGALIGLKDVRATLARLRPPDGHGGIELDKFHTPNAVRFGPVEAPVNTLGFRRVMFAVDDIDAVVARMRASGAELIGEMQYEDTYRLAYIRGPEGIIVGLSEEL